MDTAKNTDFAGLPDGFGDPPVVKIEMDVLSGCSPEYAKEIFGADEVVVVPVSHVSETASPFVTYLAGLSKRTRQTVTGDLNTIARMAGFTDAHSAAWEKLDYATTQMIRSNLAEKYPPATANRMLSAVRGVLKASWRLGLMDSETYHRATDIETIRGVSLPAGRCVTQEEVNRLFDVCANDESSIATRDAAIIALLYGAGLRRAEVPAICLSDYNAHNGEIRVKGKGNKQRIVRVTNGGKTALDDWITIRNSMFVNRLDSAPDTPHHSEIFLSIDRWGNIGDPITQVAVYKMFAKRCCEAGIGDISPHDLRRTFITNQLEAGTDIKTVADMVGHSSMDTTGKYDRRGEAAKIDAANAVHVPYRRKL